MMGCPGMASDTAQASCLEAVEACAEEQAGTIKTARPGDAFDAIVGVLQGMFVRINIQADLIHHRRGTTGSRQPGKGSCATRLGYWGCAY